MFIFKWIFPVRSARNAIDDILGHCTQHHDSDWLLACLDRSCMSPHLWPEVFLTTFRFQNHIPQVTYVLPVRVIGQRQPLPLWAHLCWTDLQCPPHVPLLVQGIGTPETNHISPLRARFQQYPPKRTLYTFLDSPTSFSTEIRRGLLNKDVFHERVHPSLQDLSLFPATETSGSTRDSTDGLPDLYDFWLKPRLESQGSTLRTPLKSHIKYVREAQSQWEHTDATAWRGVAQPGDRVRLTFRSERSRGLLHELSQLDCLPIGSLCLTNSLPGESLMRFHAGSNLSLDTYSDSLRPFLRRIIKQRFGNDEAAVDANYTVSVCMRRMA